MITAQKIYGNYIIEIKLETNVYKVRVFYRGAIIDHSYHADVENAIKWGEALITKQNEMAYKLKDLIKQGWRFKE